MKIERKNYPFVEPVNQVDRTDNDPKRRGRAGEPADIQDRVEISREAKLKIELQEIQRLMKEKINDSKAYAVLEAQCRQLKQELEELEM